MNRLDLYYLYWLLGRAARGLGLWGVLGFGVMVGCIVFYISTIRVMQQDIQSAQYDFDQAKIDASKHLPEQTVPVQTSSQEVDAYLKRFPNGASLPKWLNLIDQIAIKQHLTLNRADYKFSQTKQGQLLRYEIVFPIVGKYPDVHQFVLKVLQEIPALALSDLQIQRDNALSPTVEARLVFVLFLKADTW